MNSSVSIIVLHQDDVVATSHNFRRRLNSVYPLNETKAQYLRRLNDAFHAGDSTITPLFQGMGTHYSFIYVGTPPQRVSVIVDTGSHHTAFPCVGCKCGKHMDPYFDPRKSSTALIKACNRNQRCMFKQSYSEGSSWQAFKVTDKVWVGGEQVDDFPTGSKLSIDFDFGCQSIETGLFRTQHVDGIMGFSSMVDTLPHQLVAQKVVKSKVFAMCFRIGGGILSIGGFDASIHGPQSQVKYAALTKSSGWFTVKLIDIFLRTPQNASKTKSIGEPAMKFNGGKGTIVDSGTTDTYLPSSVRNSFERAFSSMSGGLKYSNARTLLTQSQFEQLPTIIYRFQGKYSEYVDVECPPASYAELLTKDRENSNTAAYAFRIYLTEGSGSVLGANFMNGHNVIFDTQGMKIGFAESDCSYAATRAQTSKELNSRDASVLIEDESSRTNSQSNCIPRLVQACNATCSYVNNRVALQRRNSESKEHIIEASTGRQAWSTFHCERLKDPVEFYQDCRIGCTSSGYVSTKGSSKCVSSPWTSCSGGCRQSRFVHSGDDDSCQRGIVENRDCQVHECPPKSEDRIISLHLKVTMPSARLWTVYQAEHLMSALSTLVLVSETNIHLHSSSLDSYSNVVAQFNIRFPQSTANDKIDQAYNFIRGPEFSSKLASAVNTYIVDSDNAAWLRSSDVTPIFASISIIDVSGLRTIASFEAQARGGSGPTFSLLEHTYFDPKFQTETIVKIRYAKMLGYAFWIVPLCIIIRFVWWRCCGSERKPSTSRHKVLSYIKSSVN